jgi:tetratricopeptide (TPR) repeat protein
MRSPRGGTRAQAWIGALALAAAVALAYLPALRAGFVWDDDANVTANANLRDRDGLRRIWTESTANQQYYPLTHTSFWVERRLFGLDAFGYHLDNVVLHGLAALLLWRVLLLLELPGAWLAAAIFAVHPLQAESVAWITERKNTLSGFFFFAAAFAGVKALGIGGAAAGGEPAAAPGRRRRWYALCCALFLGAVLAKSVAGLLPPVLALLLWWKRDRLTVRDLAPLVPLTLLGAAAGLHTAWLEQHHVGAVGPEFTRTPAETALVAGRAAWFYLGKLVLPAGLSFIYPRWRLDVADPAGWLYPAAALALIGALGALRGRIGKGPATAALYYGVMLFPALGFLKVYFMRYAFVQDHFQYLAGVGPIALFAAGASALAGRARGAGAARLPSSRALSAALALLLLAPLVLITRERCGAYRDEETLWRDTLARNPAAWIAHNNLGVLLTGHGRLDEALRHLEEALRLRPDLAEIRVSLGAALLAAGRAAEAGEQYRRAVALSPELPSAHAGLGAALEREGRGAEALAALEEALRLEPEGADLRYRLAGLHLRRGDPARAAVLVEELLRRDPAAPRAHALAGEILAAQGKGREAEAAFREAIRLGPGGFEGHLGLGVLLAARGDLGAAAASLDRALAAKPDAAAAHYNLGRVLDLRGETAEAVRHYRQAIATDPGFAEAHNNLGVDLLLQGQADPGREHLREALRLRPDYREARVNLELSRAGGRAGRP